MQCNKARRGALKELSSRVSAGRQDLDAERTRTGALTAETKQLERQIDELRAAGTVAESAKPLLVRIASFLLLPPKRGMETPPWESKIGWRRALGQNYVIY